MFLSSKLPSIPLPPSGQKTTIFFPCAKALPPENCRLKHWPLCFQVISNFLIISSNHTSTSQLHWFYYQNKFSTAHFCFICGCLNAFPVPPSSFLLKVIWACILHWALSHLWTVSWVRLTTPSPWDINCRTWLMSRLWHAFRKKVRDGNLRLVLQF